MTEPSRPSGRYRREPHCQSSRFGLCCQSAGWALHCTSSINLLLMHCNEVPTYYMQRNMFGLCCQSAVWQLHYIYLINSFYSLSTLQPTYYIHVWSVFLMSWAHGWHFVIVLQLLLVIAIYKNRV